MMPISSRKQTQNRPGVFQRSLGLLIVPLVIIWAPLLFHRSSQPPVVLSYSGDYLLGLLLVLFVIVGFSVAVSLLCRARGDLWPAQLAFLLILVSLAVAIVAEGTLRFLQDDAFANGRRWGLRRSLILGAELDRNFSWSAAGAHYSTDQFGFRTNVNRPDWHAEEPPVDKNAFRIFVLGGSSAFGFGLNDDETWSHYLQNKLSAVIPDASITVVNAGVNGFYSLQVLLRLYVRVLPHKPTHVIFYESMNDAKPYVLTVDSKRSEQILFSTTLHDYLNKRYENLNYYLRTNLAEAARQLIGKLRSAAKARSGDAPTTVQPADPEVLAINSETYRRNVETFIDICRRHTIEPVLVTFLYDHRGLRNPSETEAVNHYNETLRSIAASEGVILVDAAQRLRSRGGDLSGYFLQDHYHLSVQGTKFLAESIHAVLAPRLRGQ